MPERSEREQVRKQASPEAKANELDGRAAERRDGEGEELSRLASEALMRETGFEAAPVAQLVVDPEGQLALANLQARMLFALAPRDIGRPLQDLEVSFRPLELRSRIEQAYNERHTITLRDLEWRVGEDLRFVDVQIVPLLTSHGDVVGCGVTFTDVTRYQRLQQALAESKREAETAYEELQSAVEELETTNEELESTNDELSTINDELQQRTDELNETNAYLEGVLGAEPARPADRVPGLRGRPRPGRRGPRGDPDDGGRDVMSGATRIVTDLNGRVIEVAEGAAKLLAIEERWLEGKPLAAFVAPEQVREFRTLVLELGHGNGPRGTSLRLQRRDGGCVDVEVEAVAEAHGDRLEWLFATPQELEPDPRVPAPTLKGLPLQRLLGRLPLGVLSVNEHLIVEYANPAARVFVKGARVGAMLPEPLSSFSLRKFALRLFGELPPTRRVVEAASGRLLELDGIPGDGRNSALLVMQDVTSRERRRRAEQEFAANAAHELRTPIAAITSALDVLREGAKDVPDDRDLFLGHIERETARLARLVAALLLLARIQTGQEQPSLRFVDAAPLLDDVAAGLEPHDGVSIHVDCAPELAMLTDADLLRQAVWNLAVNAAAHTVRGEIRLTGRDLGRMAELEVRDTGSGIAEVDREQVFDRFYRLQRRVGSGFGLGLPLALEIARVLGGTLTLDSEPGVGTRARVHVPSARLVA